MKIIKLLEEQLLQEGRLENVLNQNKSEWLREFGDTPSSNNKFIEVVNILSRKDPSGDNKYLDWMVKRYIENPDILAISTAVEGFNSILPKLSGEFGKTIVRDSLTTSGQNSPIPDNHIRKILQEPKSITHYPDVDSVNLVVKFAKSIPSKQEIKTKIEKTETKYVYENNRYEIVIPKTHRSSCHWGRGTAWCIKLKDNSSFFNDYSANSYLFYIIDKYDRENVENPLFKLCVRWFKETNVTEIWNSFDQKLGEDLSQFLPSDMINAMGMFIDSEKIIYNVINQHLIPTFLNTKQIDHGFIRKGPRGFYSDKHECSLLLTVDSEKSTIIGNFECFNGEVNTAFRSSFSFDLHYLTELLKMVNIKTKTINVTIPKIGEEISSYLESSVNQLIENQMEKIWSNDIRRYFYEIIESDELDKKSLTGNFVGDWRITDVKEDQTNNIIIIYVKWPEDPEETKLTLKFSIRLNDITNAEYVIEGIENEGTKDQAHYDEEVDIVDLSDFVSNDYDANGLIEDFMLWCVGRMNELLQFEG